MSTVFTCFWLPLHTHTNNSKTVEFGLWGFCLLLINLAFIDHLILVLVSASSSGFMLHNFKCYNLPATDLIALCATV